MIKFFRGFSLFAFLISATAFSQPVNITFTTQNVSCPGGNDGYAIANATGGAGDYGYLWNTGSILDSIGGLTAGMYVVTVTDTVAGGGLQTIYSETFDPAGAWTLNVPTGPNGADPNFWMISDDEGGVLPPGCGVGNNGNQTLYITSVFCPTCGAAYDAGGLCGFLFCPETNSRAESPFISTIGFSNLTLNFDFISMGDALLDNASVWYNAGAGWLQLNPSIKTLNCGGGQGMWTSFSAVLPVACNNIANLQIGFNWTNNDDGAGTDPSVAINNITITTPVGAPVINTYQDSVLITEPPPYNLQFNPVNATCNQNNGAISLVVTGGNGNYSYLWSPGGMTTANLTNLAPGTYTVTVTDTAYVAGGGGGPTNQVIHNETFDPAGAWTLNVPTGPNGADPNFWMISDDEGGVLPPGCGVGNNGNQTLYITSVFCPTCGAAYDAGGLCGFLFCPETNSRAESPPINTVGFNTLTLDFDFISMGDALLDNASVWYNAGAGWNLLNPSIKTINCGGGQGQWTAFSAALPVACNNIPNLQIGFNWTNNDDGVGTDPSVAINNLKITAVVPGGGGGGTFVLCTTTGQVTITSSGTLTMNTGVTNAGCGGGGGTAWVIPTSGTAPYTFAWNNGATNDTIFNVAPGNYTVTVTDALGCIGTANVTVGQAGGVIAAVGAFTNVSCFGLNDGTATAQANGGTAPYTYAWSNGQVTQQATNLAPGTYTVTITDANSCTGTATVGISEPTAMTSTVTATDVSCNGGANNGTAFINVSGGTPGYAYMWSNGANTAFVSGLAAGTYTVTVTDAMGCVTSNSAVINQQSAPTINAGPDQSFCEGTGGVMINATPSGGTAPYFYTWSCNQMICGLDSVFDNDPIANPSVTATYYIFVTDFNGCESLLDSLVVTVLPKPVANAGPDLWICGDSAPCQLLTPSITNAPGPYIFDWTPGVGLNDSTLQNPCARPDTTTIYALVVTSGNGCTSDYNTLDTVSTVIVHVNLVPVADAGPDKDICYLDSTMLQGIGFGAGPVYGYQWSPAIGLASTIIPNPMASPSLTTDYILTVWSNNCPSYGDTMTVNVHVNPTVDAGPDIDICPGEIATLHAQGSGDSTATSWDFNWSPSSGVIGTTNTMDLDTSPDSTTMYYVIVTTNWGCQSPMDSALVTVKPYPLADAGPNVTICSGTSVILQGSYYYTSNDTVTNPSQIFVSWTPSSTLSDTTILNPTATPGASTYYYLTLNYSTCSSIDSVLIAIIPTPVISLEPDTTSACEGDSIHIHASGGLGNADFDWSPSAGLSSNSGEDIVAYPNDTTTYTLIVSEGGCKDTASVTLNIIAGPQMAYESSLTEGCVPFPVNFLDLSDNVIFYSWDFGDGHISNDKNPTHIYETPGIYIVTLTGSNSGACKSSLASIVVDVADTAHASFTSNPQWPVIMNFPNTNVEFTNTTLNGSVSYWNFGDGVHSDEWSPSHIYLNEGEYFVTLIAENERGCQGKVTHGPYVVMSPEVFIPNVFSPNNDDINDIFLIKYTGSQPFLLNITDRWGNLVYSARDKYEGWNGKAKSQDSPDGVYFYTVKIGDKEYVGNVTLVR